MSGSVVRQLRSRPQAVRRSLLFGDQAASSLSNILVAVLAARELDDVAAFGAFSLAMVTHQLILGCVRALVGESLLSLYSHEEPGVRSRLVADLLGATLSLGIGSSVVLLAASAALGGLSGEVFFGLALVLPLVLLQDTWRFVFVIDRPGRALLLDVVWLVSVVVALSQAPADAGVTWFVVVWGLCGAAGAVVGFLVGGRVGRPHPWRWITEHRATGFRYLGETLTARLLQQVLLSGLAAIAGLGALGAARAAQIFYGPLNTLQAGLNIVIVPEGAALRQQPDRLRRKIARVSVGLGVLAGAWMLVGLMLPAGWGRLLFKATWDDAGELMLPFGLATIAAGVLSAALLGHRSLGDAKRSFRSRLRASPWMGACPLIGAVLGGAWGFGIGTAVGTIVGASIWWRSFGDALAAASQRADDPGGEHGHRSPVT